MASSRKVLLMGKTGAGKTSIRCVIFSNYIPNDTKTISPTIDIEHSYFKFLGNMYLNIWDCGGQGKYVKEYFSSQKETIFKCVDVFIYVFDVESTEFKSDLENYMLCVECLKQYSPHTQIFSLLHKMDLIELDHQEAFYQDRTTCILKASGDRRCNFYSTSIWDETIFKAWSDIAKQLIPNIVQIQKNLNKFAELIEADEIIIFEKSSFLVLCHCERRIHPDSRRFEKITNIIKHFRNNCKRGVLGSPSSIEVRNSKFAAYIESFTPSTFVLVVTSDPDITSIATLMNIKSGSRCFESLEMIGTRSPLTGSPESQ